MHHCTKNYKKKNGLEERKKNRNVLCPNHKLTYIGRHSRSFGNRKEILFHMLSE
jgi:hypothetical protein